MRLDTLYHDGRITTMDPQHPVATRLGILGGRVVAVDDDVDGLSADAHIDLAGQHVIPGFNDAHRHLLIDAQRKAQIDVRDNSVEHALSRIAERARTAPGGSWIVGFGVDHRAWDGRSCAQVLNSATDAHPVWLEDMTGHVGIANSAALRLAGLTDGWRDDDMVPIDAEGRALGIVKEHAVGVMRRVIGPTDAAVLPGLLSEIALACASEGITSVTEAGIGATLGLGDGPTDAGAFLSAQTSGRMPLRVTLMPYVTALHAAEGIDALKGWRGLDLGIRTGFGDERLRIGAVKVLVDGSLRGRTAAMKSDYLDSPGARGMFQFAPDRYRTKVAQLHGSGWSIASHAIGDHAIDVVIDAYEQVFRAGTDSSIRHRIEHVSVLTDHQVHRLAQSGIVAVPQGRFISEMGDAAIDVLGPERSRQAFRLRSLVDAGVVIAGSSDAPVVDGSPLKGIHDMVNRRTAEGRILNAAEALSPQQALHAYTVGSAYAAGEERRKGMLRRGFLADLTVLSDDILTIDATRIGAVEVGATVLAGDIVHNSGAIDV